mmetsp:Transcript_19837/g.57547  ORF Transcript_19837/g.57547 Transcript_19837/m.57547 type:complete len:271 (-) Transcript_19837:244-1056(-)|eukprot:CAMPEP_0113553500 /NCGR_PEP_ID=MMETSP0015_2-20120614/15645_1 /TAXON_ID=2838 /ORGANISM="Odontella" /LENGTH=270 /DNA_ID=CAMNT_0000454571 /DNA_START=114 /DNA_END=926 /DNA_ORIENTATION=- /assembly_acc=CAM_ASM_000160
MSALVLIGDASPNSGGDSTLTVDVKAKPDLSSCLRSTARSSLESIEIVVSATDLSEIFDPLGLAGLIPSLKAGGSVAVRVVGADSDPSIDLAPISTAFLLAGLNAESERKEEGGARVLTARKSISAGGQKKTTSAKIRLNFPEEKKTADAPGKVTLDDLEDDDALIDEDELLTGGAIAAPPTVDVEARAKAVGGDDDCGGRTACDNCTCGRAENEAAEAAGEAKKEEGHESHCGNCSKGDAFRCASCPFLGKPAFKPGEEHLVLELSDDL